MALGADGTFPTCVTITRPGRTVSNTGCSGEGEFVRIPRVDRTHMTSHTVPFDEVERAFEVSDKDLDEVVKVLVTF